MKPVYRPLFLLVLLFTAVFFPIAPTVFANIAEIGIVQRVEGDLYIEREGAVNPVSLESILMHKDILTTGRRGRAEVLLSMGNKLAVLPNSEVDLDRTDSPSLRYLYQIKIKGEVGVEINNSDAGELQFMTPHTLIMGETATFNLSVDHNGTKIHLLEGRLELITNINAYTIQLDAKVPVGMGTQATLKSEGITVKVNEDVLLPPVKLQPKTGEKSGKQKNSLKVSIKDKQVSQKGRRTSTTVIKKKIEL